METRRELKFEDWDAVVSDLRSLSQGYTPHGKWDLGQAAKHLNEWLRYPMDGFPSAPWPIQMLMSALRLTVGKSILKKAIATGKMKDGAPTAPNTVYERCSPESTAEAVSQLEQTIERFRNYTGPIHRSPIFGEMDKQTAEQLQWVHFAHHLSWLQPT